MIAVGRADVEQLDAAKRRIIKKMTTAASSATFYKWKVKFGGLEVSDARKLKALEDENTMLKKLLAEQMLDNAMLKGLPCLAAIGPRPMADASRRW